jgi:hypothetical protein
MTLYATFWGRANAVGGFLAADSFGAVIKIVVPVRSEASNSKDSHIFAARRKVRAGQIRVGAID